MDGSSFQLSVQLCLDWRGHQVYNYWSSSLEPQQVQRQHGGPSHGSVRAAVQPVSHTGSPLFSLRLLSSAAPTLSLCCWTLFFFFFLLFYTSFTDSPNEVQGYHRRVITTQLIKKTKKNRDGYEERRECNEAVGLCCCHNHNKRLGHLSILPSWWWWRERWGKKVWRANTLGASFCPCLSGEFNFVSKLFSFLFCCCVASRPGPSGPCQLQDRWFLAIFPF